MAASLRVLVRRVLDVQRIPTYYFAWLTLNSLECALIHDDVGRRAESGELVPFDHLFSYHR